MNYITTVEASKKWKISITRISILAKNGRIPGAVQIGSRWMIPESSEKPIDGRTRMAKTVSNDFPFYRYPGFEHRYPDSFYPSLSPDECMLKGAEEAFYACRFEEADRILNGISVTDVYNKSIYTYLFYLRIGCAVDISLGNCKRFFERYGMLQTELLKEFPYKKEVLEYIHEIDATLGFENYYRNDFIIDPKYSYHESFLPHLASLGALSLTFFGEKLTNETIKAYEINCKLLESTCSYADLQSLHIYLGSAYAMINSSEEMTYHFHKALKLCEKFDLFYIPALQYFYMRKLFEPALSDFSESFKLKLEALSNDIHNRYTRFSDKAKINSIYKLLSHRDFIFLYYAEQGYSNKEIADILKLSIGTVGKHYSNIYSLLGIESKTELVKLYNDSVNV